MCCGSGSGESVNNWLPGSGSVILLIRDSDLVPDPYYLSKILNNFREHVQYFIVFHNSLPIWQNISLMATKMPIVSGSMNYWHPRSRSSFQDYGYEDLDPKEIIKDPQNRYVLNKDQYNATEGVSIRQLQKILMKNRYSTCQKSCPTL